MKYPSIKKHRLSHKFLSEVFGYKNINSFRHSSKHKVIMKAVEEILTKIKQYENK